MFQAWSNEVMQIDPCLWNRLQALMDWYRMQMSIFCHNKYLFKIHYQGCSNLSYNFCSFEIVAHCNRWYFVTFHNRLVTSLRECKHVKSPELLPCQVCPHSFTLGARHNTAREVLWKYADSIPDIVNILWQKYFDSMVPYFDSTKGTEAVS